MSVPKRHQTSSRSKRRRSHHALQKSNLAACSKCAKPVFSHRACSSCGNYNGREATKVKERSTKTNKEARAGKR